MQTNQFKGVLIMLMTVLIWGATFPVGKAALQALDAFWMSSIRYGAATLVLLAISAIAVTVTGSDIVRLQKAVLRTVLLMWWLRAAYFLGADPARLALRYGYRPHAS